MKLAALQRQVYEAEANRTPIVAAEVGPATWDALLDMCEAGTQRKWPPGARSKMRDGHFMGIPIRPSAEVPEGQLWPLESV